MMLTTWRSGLAACLFVLLFPTLGKAAELLRSVAPEVVDSFMAPEKFKLQYGLRTQLYVAKKYRIVEIDFDLLNQPNAEFTITPWEGLVMNVKAVEIEAPGSYAGLRAWSGMLTNSWAMIPTVNLTIRDFDQNMPVKLIKRIQAESSRKPLPPHVLESISGSYVPSDGTILAVKSRTVLGRMYGPAFSSINIAPIEDDPRYHVIFEVDPDKQAMGGGVVAPEEAEKAKRMQEFVEQVWEERARDFGR